MTYCAVSDVEALNAKRTYGANTTPNRTQVEAYVTAIAGEIDSVLAARDVDTPVTAPASFLAFLLHLNALGAASLAENAANPELSGGIAIPGNGLGGGWFTQQQQGLGSRWYQEYQKGLAELKDGSAVNPGAALSGDATLARTYLTDYPDNDPYEDGSTDGQQPVFSMGAALRDF